MVPPTKNQPKSRNLGKWIDDIHHAIGGFIRVETSDGVRRSGRLTGLRSKAVLFNGTKQEIVTDLELNGDPSDCVQMSMLASVSIDNPVSKQR